MDNMDFQPKTTERFWVPKPVYKQISVGFESEVDYWTVGTFALASYFSVGNSKETILTGFQLTYEAAVKLANLFEKERLSALSMRRPAYYQRILKLFFSGS